MMVCGVSCFLLLVTCSTLVVLGYPTIKEGPTDSEDTLRGDYAGERWKRSAIFNLLRGIKARSSLLKDAKQIPSGNMLARKFVKYGGSDRALKDFKSVKPGGVKTCTQSDKTCVSTGWVGDRQVILKDKDVTDGKPRIEIRENNSGLITDIITYAD